jgi:hypothetical protein
MFIRLIAVLFGIGFIFVGVAGFLPEFTKNGLLFGYFLVDNVHNLVHIVSGVIAIMAATNVKFTLWYFRVFGVVYLLVAILGFWRNGDLYIMYVNMADNLLHLGIGLIALFFGLRTARQ